jgi:Spy/CpxP family protein refolding chaperone
MKGGTIVFSLFLLLSAIPGFSQPSGMRMNPGVRPWRGEIQCWRALDLNLSPEQLKEIKIIQQAYLKETQLLRSQLFAKRLELRESMTNPNVKSEIIRSQHGEIAELEYKFEEKVIEYLLKLRNLLTQEQLKIWCPEKEAPFFRGMGPGHGMMDPWPRRKPPSPDIRRRGDE